VCERETADPGHSHVGDQQIHHPLDQYSERLIAIRGGQHRMAGLGQDGDENLPQLQVVVHEKDSFRPSRLPATLLAAAQRDFAFQESILRE
jgi:hypothetical protein